MLCEDTGCCPEDLPRAMNDRRSGERGSGISVLPARYDDDDEITCSFFFIWWERGGDSFCECRKGLKYEHLFFFSSIVYFTCRFLFYVHNMTNVGSMNTFLCKKSCLLPTTTRARVLYLLRWAGSKINWDFLHWFSSIWEIIIRSLSLHCVTYTCSFWRNREGGKPIVLLLLSQVFSA